MLSSPLQAYPRGHTRLYEKNVFFFLKSVDGENQTNPNKLRFNCWTSFQIHQKAKRKDASLTYIPLPASIITHR